MFGLIDPLAMAYIRESRDPVRAARYRPFGFLIEDLEIRRVSPTGPDLIGAVAFLVRREWESAAERVRCLVPASGESACCPAPCC